MATLTYVYSDSTAVLGPLAAVHEPHHYDLCEPHAARLTAPRGWTVVKVAPSQDNFPGQADPAAGAEVDEADRFFRRQVELSKPLNRPDDDWALLAEAVQEEDPSTQRIQSVTSPFDSVRTPLGNQVPTFSMHDAEVDPTEITRRGHLRVLRGEG